MFKTPVKKIQMKDKPTETRLPAFSLLAMVFLIALFFIFWTGGCATKAKQESSTHFLMDTMVQIDIYSKDPAASKESMQKAFARMQSIADRTDRYSNSPASDCFRINKAAGYSPVAVSPDTLFLTDYVLAKKRPEINLAVGPLVDLWAVNTRKLPPAPEAVQRAKMLVAVSLLSIDKKQNSVALQPAGALIDFGAVAKGYAIDQAAAVLAADKNITGALVNGGGNIKTIGSKSDGQPWRIGVQDPRDPQRLLGTLTLSPGEAVSTSGDYQRYFELNGQRYHHIISPASGYPSRENISVTIVAKDALTADYYSTLLFILPLADSFSLLRDTPQIQAVIVNKDGKAYISAGLKDKFTPDKKGGRQYVQK